MPNPDKNLFLQACTHMPASYFSVPLGLGALALAWHKAEPVFEYAHSVSLILTMMAILIWVFFLCIYIVKIKVCPQNFLQEYHCPIRFSLIMLIPISSLVIGELLFVLGFLTIGKILIFTSILIQIGYATWRIGMLWRGDTFTENATLPTFYLPAVAANFTSASGLSLLGFHDVAQLFFGAGLFAWIIFEPVLLQYLRTHQIPQALRPTMGIILAPAFVGANAYLSITAGEVDFFAKMLWGYGLLQLLFLIRLFSWIAEGGIDARFWSFSFGLASMAGVAILFYQSPTYHTFGLSAFIFANSAMLILIIFTLIEIFKGRFFKL
ncbi:dicarboxylate transporter/tellurite-resistance protein TehA [Moraxella sp. ZY210820]|uniref:SLAC1 family transporter n=1 Tax=unclassified Moraxella TaxID=2685852 RepID=UPI0027310CC2|nr:dicarboxylate transporter/tellurite-resistance protein TehA [Moraxella sp. ZY210820]WLF83540.1 dicarboxylate transporter/tellurite-resistance protein TehA [Moraxella sp. ZY210820]